jgi:asparagine synthase (glutamine-hydrolysing)
VTLDGAPVTQLVLDAMIAATPHIGPDGVGTWFSGPACMIRFHHATTPEAVGETQPLPHPASGNTIAFDGRIDNRPELLSLLDRRIDSPEPDCALVLALFERFGDGFLDRLVGDYAFAIWTEPRRRLFCARSPMGWRTFLWTQDRHRFGFASQPRTLIEGLSVERRLNEGAIGEYLSARFVTQTETLWHGVSRLDQGGALALEDGRVRTWHWHKGPFEDWSDRSEADHVERFNALFDQALASSMRSAAPVMSQLSGGLDSSSVVCRATELHRAGRIDRQVVPITVRYPGQPHDESEWSGAVEAKTGVAADVATPDHFNLDAQRSWCAETLHLPLRPNVMTAMAAPMRMRGARVLLTGEGGDDWLGGSHGHWPDLVMRGQWLRLLHEATEKRPLARYPGALKGVLLEGVGPIVSTRRREHALRPHLDFNYAIPPWIKPDWAQRIGLADRWRADAMPVDLPNYAQRQRYHVYTLARRHVNWDNVLALAGSMGIEVRHPLHDLRLTSFLMGAAGGVLQRDIQKKYLLREAMRGTLPETVRTRTGKANFVSTLFDAVSERFRERRPEDLLGVRMGWVDGAMLATAHQEHLAWRDAGFPRPVPKIFYSPVWFTIAMDLWLEHAFGL